MRSIAFLIVFAPLVGVAQDRIEGLVEIPALHSRVNSGVRDSATGPVPLFAAPNDQSEVSMIIRDRRELESEEHDYGEISAVVYARAANSGGGFWYRLRYVGEGGPAFGWLNQSNAGVFRTVGMLIRSHLPHLTSEWDGRLYRAPDFNAPVESLSNLAENQSVRLIDEYRRGDQPLWFLLAIVRGNCGGEPIEVIATGWIPAYSESGGNNVWYASRGC